MKTLTIRIRESETPGYHVVSLAGEILVQRAHAPLLETARILLKRGHDPRTVLHMAREGAEQWDARGRLDVLADLSVDESKMAFRRYEQWQGTNKL